MKLKTAVLIASAGLLALASTCSLAGKDQNRPYNGITANTGNGLDNPDWVEEQVAPPPAFSVDRLIALDMPPHVTVKVGVDPQTIGVGSDGVVRYVIVMRNATGTTTASYEGIRCITDEVKTYARWSSSGQWNLVQTPEWIGLNESMRSQHAKAFARQGGCQARLATSPEEIIQVLKNGGKAERSNKAN